MSYIVICVVALVVSGLTLFSGFGLGTLLMPAFALFFPVEIAVGATAVVHLANNIFKAVLVGRKADFGIVLKFALPAAAAAVLGALLLNYFAGLAPVFEYTWGGRSFAVTPVKLVVAVLVLSFALIELSSRFEKLSFDTRFIPLGGFISGFFGGPLRPPGCTAFGLPPARRVGEGSLCRHRGALCGRHRCVAACGLWGHSFFKTACGAAESGHRRACGCRFSGSFPGSLHRQADAEKVTMRGIQVTVGAMLLLLAVALALGLV